MPSDRRSSAASSGSLGVAAVRAGGSVIGCLLLGAGLSLSVPACATDVAVDDASGEHEHEAEPTGEVSNALVGYDCATHTDTGYTNGKSFPITVVTVDGKPVEVETANAFLTMAKAAEANGINLRINSGFRTYAEQQYLYNCYINKNCNNGNLAAKPGYSNHQSGHALDINTSGGALDWLNAHGGQFGFKRTVPSENWHWEWWGGGSPQTFCGNKAPQGYLDAASCDGVSGWAFDAEAGAAPIAVHVYFGAPAGGAGIIKAIPLTADVPRDDLCGVVGSCNHGFSMLAPLSLFDNVGHGVYAYGINAPAGDNPLLTNSPREMKCAPTIPAGVTRWVPNPTVLAAWKLDYFQDLLPADKKTVDAITREKNVGDAPVLARAEGGDAVYLLDRGQKRHVPNPSVMSAWRFDWGSIQVKPKADIDALPDGKPVRPRPVLVADSEGRVLLVDDAGPAPPKPPPAAGGSGGAGGSSSAAGAAGSTASSGDAGAAGSPGDAGAGGDETGAGGSETSPDPGTAGAAGTAPESTAGAGGATGGSGGSAGPSGRGTGTDVTFDEGDASADGACAVGASSQSAARRPVSTSMATAMAMAGMLGVLGLFRRRWRRA